MRSVPPMDDVIEELRSRQMLPAIWFVFSRKGCDAAAAQIARDCRALVTEAGERVDE